MNTLRTVADIRRHLTPLGHAATIGLVPTMGALHEGHVALFRAARESCSHVVATIFVNPTQFNDPADFDAYPRQDSRDAAIAAGAGVDTLFVPAIEDIYGPDDATAVEVQGAARGFEGDMRPGHFRGVATVCLKLFSIVSAQAAFFGQKDAQQVAVVRQIVRDLHLNLQIRVVPTVRDADGLALSSRNVRLSSVERRRALAIPRALRAGLAAAGRGDDPAVRARAELDGLQVDYAAVAQFDGEPTLVIAVRVGEMRLIDNVPLRHPELAGLGE
jgi:pantoate--beta-alanine ligase